LKSCIKSCFTDNLSYVKRFEIFSQLVICEFYRTCEIFFTLSVKSQTPCLPIILFFAREFHKIRCNFLAFILYGTHQRFLCYPHASCKTIFFCYTNYNTLSKSIFIMHTFHMHTCTSEHSNRRTLYITTYDQLVKQLAKINYSWLYFTM
jgi:hypothetical protein